MLNRFQNSLYIALFTALFFPAMIGLSTKAMATDVAYIEATDSSALDVGSYSSPTLEDTNADGLFEMYVGGRHSAYPYEYVMFLYQQDSGNPSLFTAYVAPLCVEDPNDPYDPTDTYVYCDGELTGVFDNRPAPAMADLDGDGSIDMLVGSTSSSLTQLEMDASDLAVYTEISTDAIPSDTTQTYLSPTIGDLDGDTYFDIVVGNYNGTVSFYEQDSTDPAVFNVECEAVAAAAADPYTGSPAVSAVYCGSETSLDIDVGNYSKPAMGDLDGDGLFDLVIGSSDGMLYHYEQGSDTYIFDSVAVTSSDPYDPTDPFAIDFGYYSAPAIADLNDDGILDIVVGSYDGKIRIFNGYNPVCGDSIVTSTISETCDDGNTTDLDGCSATCTTETAYTYYADADVDNFGNAASSITSYSSTPPSGYVTNSDDCDDTNARIRAQRSFYQDNDRDFYGSTTVTITACTPTAGYIRRGGDCDDARRRVNPGAAEVAGNGIDDNCDGTTL